MAEQASTHIYVICEHITFWMNWLSLFVSFLYESLFWISHLSWFVQRLTYQDGLLSPSTGVFKSSFITTSFFLRAQYLLWQALYKYM